MLYWRMCLLDDQGKPGTCLRMHQGHSKCCLLNHTLKKPGANSLPFNSYFLCKYIVEHMDETYYVIFKYSIYWNNNNNYIYLMALIIAIFYMIILRTTLQLLHMCIVIAPPGPMKSIDFRGFSGPNGSWAPPPGKIKNLSPPGQIPEYAPEL